MEFTIWLIVSFALGIALFTALKRIGRAILVSRVRTWNDICTSWVLTFSGVGLVVAMLILYIAAIPITITGAWIGLVAALVVADTVDKRRRGKVNTE